MPRKRRGIRRNATAVWFEHPRVVTLTRSGDGRVGFAYDPGWLA